VKLVFLLYYQIGGHVGDGSNATRQKQERLLPGYVNLSQRIGQPATIAAKSSLAGPVVLNSAWVSRG